jgi:hypothetical protein
MGELRMLDRSGDQKIIWSKDNQDEIDAAKCTFDTLTSKGFKAYAVKVGGKKGKEIEKFDPDMEKIILVPKIVGG